ncbi:MAG TPA: hypothetical protein ENI23_09100 [bacterium]|nr:hypothetical protein [bacterium]
MVATVIINIITGAAAGATTDITGINTRANAQDAHSTGDITNPIEIPAAGTNYSFWRVTRLEATVAPDNLIDNIEWFTDGSNTYGIGITNVMNTATAYVQATGTDGVTGIELTVGNYATLAGAPTDSFAFTTGSPKVVAGSTSTAVEFGDRAVFQVQVGTTATAGTKPATPETFTYRFDET